MQEMHFHAEEFLWTPTYSNLPQLKNQKNIRERNDGLRIKERKKV